MKEPPTPADRVRERLQHWMDTTGIGQREFAADLGKSQIWLQKILAGENHVRLRDLDQVARALRTTAAELVRASDDRYQIEATPTELRLIEKFRYRPELFAAVATLMDLRLAPKTETEVRTPSASPRKKSSNA